MKFPLVYVGLICAGLLAAPSSLRADTNAPVSTNGLGPRIAFDSKEYDFGKVLAGTIVKHIFVVSNAGDQTLIISKLQPGCHCTTAGDVTPINVAPGQTHYIHIQFDSGSFRGPVTKPVTVTCNDKTAPVQSLRLVGTIWRSIEVDPQFAYIQVRPDLATNTAVVHIKNQSGQPVTLSEPTSANAAFKATLATITPGQTFDLTVTAIPPLAPGNTVGTISVKTSLTNMPVLSVTAIAMVQRPAVPPPIAPPAASPTAPPTAPLVGGHP